jgi:Domain of unknown function (DUF4265)
VRERTTLLVEERLVKLFIPLEPTDWHSHRTESVWANPLPEGLYRVRNVPFYALGVSCEDVVWAELDGDMLSFRGVVRRGGHSTYRFFLLGGITEPQWEPYWQPLEEIGCTYEQGIARFFAVDLPPEADLYKAYELLDRGERAGVWGFEEAHGGHPLQR